MECGNLGSAIGEGVSAFLKDLKVKGSEQKSTVTLSYFNLAYRDYYSVSYTKNFLGGP